LIIDTEAVSCTPKPSCMILWCISDKHGWCYLCLCRRVFVSFDVGHFGNSLKVILYRRSRHITVCLCDMWNVRKSIQKKVMRRLNLIKFTF
jgi:hypothetical protein